jgi:hypothetical protein
MHFIVDTQHMIYSDMYLPYISYLGVKIVLLVVELPTGLVPMGMAVAAAVAAADTINNKQIKDGTNNRAIPKHLPPVMELTQMVSGINITNSTMDSSKEVAVVVVVVVVTNDPMSRQRPYISLIL